MAGLHILSVLTLVSVTISGQWHNIPQRVLTTSMGFTPANTNPLFDRGNRDFQPRSAVRIPFPQCVLTESAVALFSPASLQGLFLSKLNDEESKLKQERTLNNQLQNNDIMDFDAMQLRADTRNGALLARAATRLTEDLLEQLSCDTNATITEQLDDFLSKVHLPNELCAFSLNANCNGLSNYRTVTGVCNNLQRPYEGSSQTAYARLLPAAYEDGFNKPRSQSVLGGPLPACRQISLALGSKPVFDTSYNNLFVVYGQFLVHDITLATPVSDSGRTPISSCTCNSKDTNMCVVIDIASNDPFMSGQKCMAVPATAEAFSDQICSLGVKDQMNGNSHYIDLSVTYGSTKTTSVGLRTGKTGLLKSMRQPWSKLELPPSQREGKSCIDATSSQKCFAGGDSRLMENVLLAGIQTQWLRAHNNFAKHLDGARPDWQSNDNLLYEESKSILSALHQRYTYEQWLPILIGDNAARQYFGNPSSVSRYDPTMPGVVFNEAATGTLRLHTLVRDLLSRCKPNGQLIDQIWLRDLTAKCKLAYDAQNNGVDSLLCGSMYDYGFAGDTNYAQEIHHRLFETTTTDGRTKRHDIVAINICRAREHGIAGYNAYRQLCGLRRASQFEDFADTMAPEAVQKLQTIYKHPDDVDLFIGVNHENPIPGALVGPVSACITGTQFKHLKYGDRFFYTHEGQFTPDQLNSINKYNYDCFICHSTDIDQVARNPFRPPNDLTNPLGLCSQCPKFDFNPWLASPRTFG